MSTSVTYEELVAHLAFVRETRLKMKQAVEDIDRLSMDDKASPEMIDAYNSALKLLEEGRKTLEQTLRFIGDYNCDENATN
jgi:hypothetical protein